MSDHLRWMNEALSEARQAAERGEVPVGAVIVRGGFIIARAGNEVERLQNATAHAEVLALRRASEGLGNWRLSDCDLYVTLEPCPMCIGAILLCRIRSVYFGALDPQMGACGSVFDLASHPELPHQVACAHGLLASESMKLLKEFFQLRRE